MCPSPAGTDTHPTDEELRLSCKSTRGHFPATPQLLTAIYYFPKIVIKTNVWGFTASSTQQETADGAVNATAPLQDRGWRGCLTRKAPSHPFPGAPPIPWWPLWPFFAPTWAEKLEVATSQGQNWRKKPFHLRVQLTAGVMGLQPSPQALQDLQTHQTLPKCCQMLAIGHIPPEYPNSGWGKMFLSHGSLWSSPGTKHPSFFPPS